MSRREPTNAIRAPSMDAVQRVNSGHSGAPMGMADIAEVLWNDLLKHNPQNPGWVNRDRFILSNGHAPMLLYSLLRLTGYDLPLSELEQFRQLHLKAPGHPEYGHTPGVETTTGPLGQGLANAVGMAIIERTLVTQFNRSGYEIIDHHTWVLMGDGCLMEGTFHEARSLAGTLGLGKPVGFHDRNGISIDDRTEDQFSDDTAERFRAYHQHVIGDIDGHDPQAIKQAIVEAQAVRDKPSLIICRTIIGFGSPNKAGSEESHGAALGEKEVALARQQLGQKYLPLEILKEIHQGWDACPCGEKTGHAWNEKSITYQQQFPELAAELIRRMGGTLPKDFAMTARDYVAKLQAEPARIVSYKAPQDALNTYGLHLPELLDGSTDPAPNNLTIWSGLTSIKDDPAGNYTHYGVRESGTTVVVSGIVLYGGFIPYTFTFLMFVKYARNAARMAALMEARQIMVYIHDSIGLGEDDPTHQAVEQLVNLCLTPNFSTWCPCDQVGTVVTWQAAIVRQNGPTVLTLSWQNPAQTSRTSEQVQAITREGYVLKDAGGKPNLIFIATGPGVEITVPVAGKLLANEVSVRIASLPSTDVSDVQDEVWRESVLPSNVSVRVTVEVGIANYWYKYVGLKGKIVDMTGYDESAPAEQLPPFFGFTVGYIVATAEQVLSG